MDVKAGGWRSDEEQDIGMKLNYLPIKYWSKSKGKNSAEPGRSLTWPGDQG